MRRALAPVCVIALRMSVTRMRVPVRVRPRGMLRFPVFDGGGVAAEHLEPRQRILKAGPLRQSARDSRWQGRIGEPRQGLQHLTHAIEIFASDGKTAETHTLRMFFLA